MSQDLDSPEHCVVSLNKTLYPLLSTGSNQEWERSGSEVECLTQN